MFKIMKGYKMFDFTPSGKSLKKTLLHMTGYAPAYTKSIEKGSFLDKRRRQRLLQKGYIFRC